LEHRIEAAVAIACRDKIGEAPAWDAAGQRLLWSDMEEGVLHEARADGAGGWRETRQMNLGVPIAAVIPRAGGGLVIVAGVEVLLMDETGEMKTLARLDVDAARFRFNDAKCDAQGRLWAGTLSRDFEKGAAALYRFDPDGGVTEALGGLTLANGLDWSPAGDIFYFVDSLDLSVDAFDFDATRGAIGNRRSIVKLRPGEGAPNGLTVDDEGMIWMALTGSGEARRYAPTGELLMRVAIATPGATSCAFGGADGDRLFITSLGRRMPDVARSIGLTPEMMENAQPHSGALFVCRPGVRGAPARMFGG
jgi:sugar lactone lactonase YvrE